MVRSGSFSVDSSASHRRTPSRTVTLGHIQPQAPSYRTVYCNDRESNQPVRFKGNSISTTKYNVFTFLPKGLFEQFRRTANIYFLELFTITVMTILVIPMAFDHTPATSEARQLQNMDGQNHFKIGFTNDIQPTFQGNKHGVGQKPKISNAQGFQYNFQEVREMQKTDNQNNNKAISTIGLVPVISGRTPTIGDKKGIGESV